MIAKRGASRRTGGAAATGDAGLAWRVCCRACREMARRRGEGEAREEELLLYKHTPGVNQGGGGGAPPR